MEFLNTSVFKNTIAKTILSAFRSRVPWQRKRSTNSSYATVRSSSLCKRSFDTDVSRMRIFRWRW